MVGLLKEDFPKALARFSEAPLVPKQKEHGKISIEFIPFHVSSSDWHDLYLSSGFILDGN